ncbi:TPA: YSIRK-type signal peptide-containing protein [Streptococcus suis]
MNRVNREYQYSIRKTTFGVGSVVVGLCWQVCYMHPQF